jgi:outer membrane protein
MSNKPVVNSNPLRLSVFLLFGVLFLSGCIHLGGKGRFPDVEVPPESVQQIEPLVLEKAKGKEISRIDTETPAQPPTELELSLAECRALTLENNLDLKVQLINPTISAESVNQEEAKFEATFGADITYSKTNQPQAYTVDVQGNKRDVLDSKFGVTLPLRTGGEINVDLEDYKVKTEEGRSFFNPSYGNSFSASISQPLLRNAGRRVNEYSIRLAELNKQITDTQTKLEAIRIIAAVDKAYWRLYAHRRLLDVRRQQYELAKALFEETESYVEVGAKPRIELMRTRASVAEKLEAIINAENDVRDTERDLKRMLNKPGLGMNTETILTLTNEPDPVRYDIQREKMVENAIENRMEMLQLELQLAQDASKIEYRRNQKLPLAALKYTYNMSGLGPDRGDSYDSLLNDGYEDHTVNLKVSIPLGNKAAKSQLRQALYERSQRLADKESQKAQITYEVLQQIDKLEATWQRIMATRQTTILNDELYLAEKRQFELGMVTSTDVLDAQTTLAEAQRLEISAISDYQISLIDLAVATGTLLGAAKVELEPVVP